jgi:protein translocase SecG subunit
MNQALAITQIIVSILIITLILLQAQGTGLGNTWTGGGETYHTRKGVEKIVFYATIVGIAIFILISLANVIL